MSNVLTLSNTGKGLKITINSFLAFLFLPFTIIGWWDTMKHKRPIFLLIHGFFSLFAVMFWSFLAFFVIDYYLKIHVPYWCTSLVWK